VATRPGVTSTILGATKLHQLEENLSALSFSIPRELTQKLEELTRPELVHPYMFFEPVMRGMLTGGTEVRAEPRWYRGG
jgi:diketogulonate reductase-like aldo/keto reductase